MCAAATSMRQLIAARALQGIGGSGLYSLAQVCLVEQGPNRPEIVGALVGVTLSISYVLGPLLGGALSAWTWRGIFWINVPFGTLAVVGIYTLWPEERRNKYGVRAAFSKIDFVGNILLVVASILLVFAIQQGGSFVWKWSSPVIISSLAISGVSWFILGAWETYLYYGNGRPIQPIFPLHLATGRVYLSSFIVTFLTGFIYIALVIKIPERLQIIYADNAFGAGIHLLPMLGPCAFGSFLGGVISKRKNLTSQTLVVGTGLQLIGIGLVYGFTSSSHESNIIFLLGFEAIYGLGVGLCFAASTIIAAIEARHDDLAAAQGAVAQARVFGGALGLSVCTIIFNEFSQTALGPGSGSGLSASDLDQIHRSPMALLNLPADLQLKVKDVYLGAFREQMLAMTVVAVVAVLVSFGTHRPNPTPVTQILIRHKEVAGRSSDTELESADSVRSLVR
ncbi:major facilitator superfamily domain-containing protein [Podospora appendiculata]|uniref:Major facilitator superfamily domain-containing protein n=1 Tax=Podospora appendiculata TaxID=314037 RepID=A0AAE1CHF7_9PEZI|nr:major facilitator superfamily domain-containing protein [Podospora appendiculata]